MRVLIADDRVWLRSALRLLLEHEAKVEVVGEAGSIRALPLCVSRLHPDLLFLDWYLPGLEVHSARQQFMDSVRAIDPNLYIVALINDDSAIGGHLSGADAFINKAEPPEQILAIMRRAAIKKMSSNGQSVDGLPLL
jgi:DNA-binding NarL/FixJ family response regulator